MQQAPGPDFRKVGKSLKGSSTHVLFGPSREKTCLRGLANNTGAYQPAHPRSLISAFVICFVESIISDLLQAKIQFSSQSV